MCIRDRSTSFRIGEVEERVNAEVVGLTSHISKGRGAVDVYKRQDPHAVLFYNLHGRSYSQVGQVEASYPFFPGFTFTAAYRWTDAKTNYNGELMEKPLTSKYKGLRTASDVYKRQGQGILLMHGAGEEQCQVSVLLLIR